MAKTKYKTEWDLTLLYKGINDPQIEKDVQKTETALLKFAKKYKNKTDYLEKESALFNVLEERENLDKTIPSSKPSYYLSLLSSLDSNNTDVKAKKIKLSDRLTKAVNETLFFHIKLGKITEQLKKQFLKSKKLEKYRYSLKVVFDHSKYNLNEDQEKILNLKHSTSSSLWVSGVKKALNKRTVKFKNKQIPLSEATGKINELPTKQRRDLNRVINQEYIAVSDFAESEINAVYLNKKINDELRGYKEPYSSTVLYYEDEDDIVQNLIDSVSKSFHISHKFYALKKKLLGLDYLEYADRGAHIGSVKKKFTFDESVEILLDAFAKAGEKYKHILLTFLHNGQIDVFPKVGKTSGAFQTSEYDVPSYVLLNHTDTFNSLQTFAHEMGHAIHSELSKTQPIMYQGYTISVAETASTFFENLSFDEVFDTLNEKEKIIALHDKIQSSVSTIFRQVAVFNFELELHREIRKEGFVSKENISKIMNKHMKSYLGPHFRLTDEDGYFFVGWSHIRNYFYVYSYAYGELISNALYEKYKKDPKYIKEVEKFLMAGGSKSPYQIFKDIGIDTKRKEFWNLGLKKIEDDIKKLEKLVTKKS